mmetsp:Transcript_101070/g.286440  ORF Transcript_101070/g.286440 Transcript_101070/m.286440 type:complete len:338 (+) Transcript_101070:84-1097(+)
MAGRQWEVVGGAALGGIVVRAGKEFTSAAEAERLSTGAVVDELEREGDRLHYKLVTGTGPAEGWVSTRLKDKVLLEQRGAAAAPHGESPGKASPASEAKDFATRLAELKERYPGAELEVPTDAWRWSATDLENYYASSGFIKPKGAQAPSPKKSPAAPPPAAKKASAAAPPDVPQFSVNEALQLQEQLRTVFKDKDFQQRFSRLQSEFPNRKQRNHPDGPAFFEAFESLTMTGYHKVLPKYGLHGDWDGVHDMYAKLVTALMHPKVKKQHEEINTLLGLPRDAVLRPAKKAEIFVYRPSRDADVPGYPLPMVKDDEGDEAHEFFVEDPATGEMRKIR